MQFNIIITTVKNEWDRPIIKDGMGNVLTVQKTTCKPVHGILTGCDTGRLVAFLIKAKEELLNKNLQKELK